MLLGRLGSNDRQERHVNGTLNSGPEPVNDNGTLYGIN